MTNPKDSQLEILLKISKKFEQISYAQQQYIAGLADGMAMAKEKGCDSNAKSEDK